ncbi:hypothetical protein FHN55_03065 [Streptomyces sp. NP160]|nr:substrate-binding domain-containing protein [Streptomyces sp. NP160]TNM69321.1 hypothetical protein FHN55_03065 [Streptomyces sp. NP160]
MVDYDDITLARLGHVRLTSVSQVPGALAAAAVRTAVERLDGDREDPVDVVIAPRPVVRGSTGRL